MACFAFTGEPHFAKSWIRPCHLHVIYSGIHGLLWEKFWEILYIEDTSLACHTPSSVIFGNCKISPGDILLT